MNPVTGSQQTGARYFSERERLMRRWGALKTERSSWDAHWREISEYMMPRLGRFFVTDRNRGDKRHNSIIDSSATRALRVLAAGMMSGMTSPARPWLRLTTSDPALDESSGVKRWLADVTRLMLMVFAKSNTYRALHSLYEELGCFGTASSVVMPDFDAVLYHYPLTIGEYAIATDFRGVVNTLYREFQTTVESAVSQFGYGRCGNAIRNMYDRGNYDQWVTVLHAIEPRHYRDTRKRDALNMPWKSCYLEVGSSNDGLLRESGFKEFPALCARWSVAGGDIYGSSPAMDALGDVKQLQHQQLRKAQAIDYQTRPPLQVPAGMKHHEIDTLPGGINYVAAGSSGAAIKSAFDVNLNLAHLATDIDSVTRRINAAFFVDLFLMFEGQNDTQMTATEFAGRREEKMLMLGPVLERLHNELLSPLVETTFARMLGAGIVPRPPRELQGRELNVEFISALAQAQRAVSLGGVDRFVVNLGTIAQLKPDVLDKFDADAWADVYADKTGLDPELIVPSEQVALVRQQRAAAMHAQAQAETLRTHAETAKNLAAAKTDTPSALTNVMDMFTGYNA